MTGYDIYNAAFEAGFEAAIRAIEAGEYSAERIGRSVGKAYGYHVNKNANPGEREAVKRAERNPSGPDMGTVLRNGNLATVTDPKLRKRMQRIYGVAEKNGYKRSNDPEHMNKVINGAMNGYKSVANSDVGTLFDFSEFEMMDALESEYDDFD